MPVAEPRTALIEAASRRNQSFHERGKKKREKRHGAVQKSIHNRVTSKLACHTYAQPESESESYVLPSVSGTDDTIGPVQ